MTSRARVLVGCSAALLTTATLAVASCAESDPAVSNADAAARADGESDAVVDANSDVACDVGDAGCPATPLTCEEADFCPVATPVDRRFSLLAVAGSGASDVWSVGSGGTAMRWNGSTWTVVPTGTSDTLLALWVAGPSDAWAAGSTATILHGDGATWSSEPAFAPDVFVRHARLHAAWGAGGDVRLGGDPFSADDVDAPIEGNLLRRARSDAGTGWDAEHGLAGRWTQATVRAIWGSSTSDVWIALDNGREEPWARGTLARGTAITPGAPLTWVAVDSRSVVPLESIWGSSASDVWAVGGEGTVRRYTGGTAFDVQEVPTHAALHGVWGSSANDVWAVGDDGTILHFDGAAWRAATVAFPAGRRPDLHGVWGSSANDVWVVGETFVLHFTGKKSGE